MRKVVTIITCYIFLLFTDTHAQITVRGSVMDNKNKPYAGCTVILKILPDSSIADFSFTNEKGEYIISYNGNVDRLQISVSGLQMTPQSKIIENKSQTVNFIVKEENIELKEVIVQPTKVWGEKDTINYLVSAFSDKGDVVISDVLKKMPGINISENGSISYQGRPINNLYIENLDMLGGRYGIATNNISAKDVSTVQVLENHQPVKALDGVKVSNNAAINLKLKEGQNGAFSIMAQLGIGGFPLIWENELSGMYFSKKKQNISTYKTNNSGHDLSKELTSFTTNNKFNSNNILGIIIPSPPSINQQRFLFNNSNAITVNNLFKTTEDSQFNFNIIYLNDHETRKSNSITSYFLSADSVLIMTEDMGLTKNTDRLETELRYNVNKTDSYFNNYLNINGQWMNRAGNICNPKEIKQQLKEPVFSLSNNLHWVKKRDENRGIELQSLLGFKSSPQTLTIQPGLYNNIFNNGNDYSALKQNVRVNNFYIDNNITLLSSFKIGNIFIDPKFGFNLDTKEFNSDIHIMDDNFIMLQVDSLQNKINLFKLNSSAAFSLRYNKNGLSFIAHLPINYNLLHQNNRILKQQKTYNWLHFQPSVNIKYQLTGKTEISSLYQKRNQTGDINTMYTSYILETYRNMNHYNGDVSESKENYANIAVTYKDILKMLFMNGEVSYNHVKRNILYGQKFNDILTITSSIKQDNSSHGLSFRGRISKGFYLMGIVTSLEGSYGTYSSEQLRQDRLVKYQNDGLNITGAFNVKPISFLSLDYKGIWNRSWSKVKSQDTFSPIRVFINNISGNIKLPQNISLYINYEHYYNSGAIGNRYLSFTDLGLKYDRKAWNFSFMWTNIFNTHNYISAYYNSINSYYQRYEIRSSNVLLKIRMKIK